MNIFVFIFSLIANLDLNFEKYITNEIFKN